MSPSAVAYGANLETQARQSLGVSSDPIYRMVARALDAHRIGRGRLIDVGCGSGGLWRVTGSRFSSYCALDAVRYDGLPSDADFHQIDLNSDCWPSVAAGDVVAAVETIEHVENPWAFMRHLSQLAKPGGWVVVTTPNQLSFLSLLTLFLKQRFSAFPDAHYPAHRTALLPSDLCRAASEAGLQVVEASYSLRGRAPLTGTHYPAFVSRSFPRVFSDNMMVVARKGV